MNLPEDFIHHMRELLGEEAGSFFQSYQEPKTYGLRINPLKDYNNSFAEDLPFTLSPVGWAREGFYAVAEEHPGRHPLHEAGAYYIQEPSAMAVVSLLDPKPGEIICDLCAAPGGKSTQIAGRLAGKGLLAANEIFSSRAKVLSQNIERFGIGNCIVCNEPPHRMAEHFPSFFQKILVDAPCSGEGMFRKDNTAIQEWSRNQVSVCAERQKSILEDADRMLSTGGVMVYSTCTFSPEEDENIIEWFLETHPDYLLEDWRTILPNHCGLEGGRKEFCTGSFASAEQIQKTLRLWPHKLKGEGHFAARLRKTGKLTDNLQIHTKKGRRKKTEDLDDYFEFIQNFLCTGQTDSSYTITDLLTPNANYQYFKEELYRIPEHMKSLRGIKLVRAGLHLGTRQKNRFKPAHALAKALSPKDVVQCHECDFETALRYLKGETIPCSADYRSWTLVSYQNISLGWGKAQNGILKNHYPKGLRIMN